MSNCNNGLRPARTVLYRVGDGRKSQAQKSMLTIIALSLLVSLFFLASIPYQQNMIAHADALQRAQSPLPSIIYGVTSDAKLVQIGRAHV